MLLQYRYIFPVKSFAFWKEILNSSRITLAINVQGHDFSVWLSHYQIIKKVIVVSYTLAALREQAFARKYTRKTNYSIPSTLHHTST